MNTELWKEVVELIGRDIKVSSGECSDNDSTNDRPKECKHVYVIQNDDGWYVCQSCGEELRYNPNKPPVSLYQLYVEQRSRRRQINRMKTLTAWLCKYRFPFEEELLDKFLSFIDKYEELFPERKNLISKDYILHQLLRKRGYDSSCILRLPKMKKTLAQNEEICRTVFESYNF